MSLDPRLFIQVVIKLCLFLAALFALYLPAFAGENALQAEKTMTVNQNVTVTVCVSSGNVIVNGSDRSEVRVVSDEAAQIELRSPTVGERTTTGTQRVDVLIADIEPSRVRRSAQHVCSSFSNLQVTVPREALVEIRTQDGDIKVSGVREARVNSMSGTISITDVSASLSAGTISGDILLKNCRGSIALRTISGALDGAELRGLEDGNRFEARSISGDINLEKLSHADAHIGTVSGHVFVDLLPARSGRYNVNSNTGDITIEMPSNASFELTTKGSRGEIINDFALKQGAAAATSPQGARVNIYSHDGTIHIRRK